VIGNIRMQCIAVPTYGLLAKCVDEG